MSTSTIKFYMIIPKRHHAQTSCKAMAFTETSGMGVPYLYFVQRILSIYTLLYIFVVCYSTDFYLYKSLVGCSGA